MTTIKNSKKLFLTLFLFFFAVFAPVSAKAASLGRPTFSRFCAYDYKFVYLKWSKVSGAQKYEIQRAMINPKKALKKGKWENWASSRKQSIKKRASGDYVYRVRAVKGKKKGAWSYDKRIFGARGRITNTIYEKPSYLWGFRIEGRLTFRLLINNKTKSQMGFVKPGAQGTVFAINRKNNKVAKKWPAYLYIAESGGYAKQINPGKENSVYFYCRMNEQEYARYKNYSFMVTASFYPNPWVEPVSTQMAIACTKHLSQSAIAGK